MSRANHYTKVIIMQDGRLFEADAAMLEITGMTQSVSTTSLDSFYQEFSPFDRRISIRGDLCQVVMTELPVGSDGWTTLLQLAAGKIAQQQVTRALQTFLSSEHGARMKEMDAKMAALEVSALSSLEEAAERAMVALKKRVTRARKHISTFAHGSRKSLQRAQSKKGSPGAKPRGKK